MRTRVSLVLLLSALVGFGFLRSASAATASKISIDPTAPTTAADKPLTFTVIATNTDGTTTDVSSQATLSTNDPRGSVQGPVYTPGKVGTWTVQASYQSLQSSATVTVTPGAAKEIVINPNSEPEQTYIGTAVPFTASVYDVNSNPLSGQVVTWSVSGEIGTIDSKGVFTPKKVGTGKVQAKLGDLTGEISVVTNPAIVTNTNTAAATNANANKNTNTVTNSAANTNTTATPATTTTKCTTLQPWAWSLMLILFLLIVAVLYALIPVTAIWPAVVALLGSAALAFVQRKYACGGQTWWAWVIVLGAIALTAAALYFRPKNQPTQ